MATRATKTTSLRLPPELWQRVKQAAELDRRSVTRAVEVALEDYCRKVERASKKEAA